MNAITPLQRWRRDDWVVPCQVQDATGQPINLTGYTIGGELWLAGYSVFQPLTSANGGILRDNDGSGRFTFVASRLLTAQALGSIGEALGSATRVLLYWIDTLGHRQTLGVVPFDVFDGSVGGLIDETPQVTLVSQATTLRLVVATAQGPAGPSQIPAAQISDSGALGQSLVKAADAATARQALGVTAFGRVAVNDTPYSIKTTDTYVGVASLTAPRTLTLPQASAYPPGQPLYIADESGQCSTDNRIIIAASGSDTIGGQPSDFIANPYGKAALHTNGTNLWTV